MISIGVTAYLYIDFNKLKNCKIQNEADLVEGVVENFVSGSKRPESFYISDYYFEYNGGAVLQNGFNWDMIERGIIQEGVYLKVFYCDGKILTIKKRVE